LDLNDAMIRNKTIKELDDEDKIESSRYIENVGQENDED
jgi:hypothetical protein